MSQFLRGAVRLHILHHANIEPVHSTWMGEELARHGYRISPGALHQILRHMQEEGLLTSRHQLTDGHARVVYEITDRGRDALAEERMALTELAAEVLDPP